MSNFHFNFVFVNIASTYRIENPTKTKLFDRKYSLYIVAHVKIPLANEYDCAYTSIFHLCIPFSNFTE